MALSLETINQRLKDLESKKKDLERRDSQKLYKAAQKILGDNFSSALVTYIISEAWESASPDQKNRWLKAAQMFPSKKPSLQKTQSAEKEN